MADGDVTRFVLLKTLKRHPRKKMTTAKARDLETGKTITVFDPLNEFEGAKHVTYGYAFHGQIIRLMCPRVVTLPHERHEAMSICTECLTPMSDAEAKLDEVCPLCRQRGRPPHKVSRFASLGKRGWKDAYKTATPLPWAVAEMHEQLRDGS